MSDERLTPHERAVIEQAAVWREYWRASLDDGDDENPTSALRDAVDALRASTAPPEPFTGVVMEAGGRQVKILVDTDTLRYPRPGLQVTVTPTERVS